MAELQNPTSVPDTREELIRAIHEIRKWESEQKDLWFWEKLGRLPFVLLDKLTPAFVQKKIGLIVNELGSYIQTGGRYLISKKAVLSRLGASGEALGSDLMERLPLSRMDQAADKLARDRSGFAAVQGAATGFGGVFTLAADIPAVLGLSLKCIGEIALCYGYDPHEKQERIFAVKVLQFASSDIVGKKAVLDELSAFHSGEGPRQVISELKGWMEVVQVYRDNFGWKKLFQMVPVAGMVFGSLINRSTLQDVAEAGKMLYRKRRAMERLELLDSPKISDSEISPE
ncbi:EcsC family protein [Paenibacillus gansuensis]|uniref:EcsC family protein n=1 Tax=Paenibacillus gansuensis TaxID=306542 RepID=A0ABW5P9A1_9BACL